jgi:hypothetical protein
LSTTSVAVPDVDIPAPDLREGRIERAAERALAGAEPLRHSGYNVPLTRRLVADTLWDLVRRTVSPGTLPGADAAAFRQ